jgi:hypothetical protein
MGELAELFAKLAGALPSGHGDAGVPPRSRCASVVLSCSVAVCASRG